MIKWFLLLLVVLAGTVSIYKNYERRLGRLDGAASLDKSSLLHRKPTGDMRDQQAQMMLFFRYRQEGDNLRAYQTIKPLAESGYDVAEFYLGEAYLRGGFVPKDEVLGLRWLEKSASQGNDSAKRALRDHQSRLERDKRNTN